MTKERISPLEAMMYDVPVIISWQSGVAEVLHHALKVDYWDVDEMANQILGLLQYPAMAREMIKNGRHELRALRWEASAGKILAIYRKLCG